MSLRSLLFATVLLAASSAPSSSVASAFVVVPITHHYRPTTTTTCTTTGTVISTVALRASEMNEDETSLQEFGALGLKMVGVLTIKAAKDIVNYPPQFMDQVARQISGKDETNPLVLVAKLMGVLVFKMVHDAVYYPMVWTQRWAECQSLDECDVE